MAAEKAHHLSMSTYSTLSRLPLVQPAFRSLLNVVDPRLNVSLCGLDFANPVGLAAGFDKQGQWFDKLAALGFGHIEIGSVTGQGQPGNPRPRMFRLPKDKAIINRMGFNNHGADAVSKNLDSKRTQGYRDSNILGINIGKTKVVPLESAADDYRYSFESLYPFADYFVINVSSPNTPGLRQLQDREPLLKLLEVIGRLNRTLSTEKEHSPKPVFLKIAPDMNQSQLCDIASIVAAAPVNGIIATNTTISRQGLNTPSDKIETIGAGGLSGKPLTETSRKVVSLLYSETHGKVPIIGVGGIFTGEDAWQMIRAGASLVQLYTGFIYGGPFTIQKINKYLLRKVDEQGLSNIQQAVGTSHS
jgi:dihydroorotate dehydrogenase